MLLAELTEKLAGLEIAGDAMDFQELALAIAQVAQGEPDQADPDEFLRDICMSIGFEIRHALEGERGFSYVENGVTEEIRKARKELFPLKNVYLRFRVDIITAAFVVAALDRLGSACDHRNPYTLFYAARRKYDALVMEALRQELSEKEYRRVELAMDKFQRRYTKDYVFQYLEEQTAKYLRMDAEKRKKALAGTLVRVLEMGDAYEGYRTDIRAAARQMGCDVSDVLPIVEYPDDFVW